MPKIVGTRERVHQPFYDSLIRTDGRVDLRTNPGQNQISSRVQLFLRSGAELSVSNLTTGGTFPSDQTFITLAVRVWTYFRFNTESARTVGLTQQAVGTVPGVVPDRVMRVHKLYHQSQNQLFWQFQAGDKPQLTTFTAYTPMAGGLDGFFPGSTLGTAGAPAGGGTSPLNFTVLAGSTISNTGPTTIQGNMGLYAGSAVVGFPPGSFSGDLNVDDPTAIAAKAQLTALRTALNLMGPGTVLPGGPPVELGGTVHTAGVYSVATSAQITAGAGVLTLNGPGTFVFIIPTTFIMGPGSAIVLTGGALAQNVYFVSGTSITIDTTAAAQGNLLAQASITLNTGASLVGRALAEVGAVTFDTNNVTLGPTDANAPPTAADLYRNNLYRANNGVPTSSALMRLARPILIPPRQGFQCIATLAAMGQAAGASLQEQLLGQIDGSVGPASVISPPGSALGTGDVTVSGADDIEKDIKYLVDGIHSRDVL
jgi:hypothetical protein